MLLFNRYEYDPAKDFLGEGGFSEVYRAYDNKLGLYVAIKLFKVANQREKYNLSSEVKRVIGLDHPNICRYYDFEEVKTTNAIGREDVQQVCILEYIDKGDLASYLQAHFSEAIRKKLLSDVLHGLGYLHQHGIIHRDIKPQNILIKEDVGGPIAKIVDFGISKNVDSIQNQSSTVLGSIEYMAPEQFNTAKYGINGKISTNLDLWAFGVMTYELVSGNPFFGSRSTGDTSEQLMHKILNVEIRNELESIGEPYRNIIGRCLEKEAVKRAQKTDELLGLFKGGPVHTANRVTKKLGTEVIDASSQKLEKDKDPGTPELEQEHSPAIEALIKKDASIISEEQVNKWSRSFTISQVLFNGIYLSFLSLIRVGDIELQTAGGRLALFYISFASIFTFIFHFRFSLKKIFLIPEAAIKWWRLANIVIAAFFLFCILFFPTEHNTGVALGTVLFGLFVTLFLFANSFFLSRFVQGFIRKRIWIKMGAMHLLIKLLWLIPTSLIFVMLKGDADSNFLAWFIMLVFWTIPAAYFTELFCKHALRKELK